VVSNIPATMFFERLWNADPGTPALSDQLAALHPEAPEILVDGCLFASNFGANLTFIGALAGLMWVRILADSRRAGLTSRVPTIGDFTRLGLLVVPPVTLATGLTIALMRG
jgi:arsenical pump membrane protein